jgi:hypothetical protein
MLLERNQVGKREMLANIIARVDAKNTPVQSMIPKGEPLTNTLVEWQADDFEDPHSDMAAEDGVDVDSFSNASPNRALLQGRAMKIRDSAMVSDFAEEVSDVAGLSKGELAESIMKKLKRLARAIEAFICGDQEAQVGAAGVPDQFRGLGVWIQSTAQAVYPVPTQFLTPAASIDTTAMASVTDTIVGDVLESAYTKSGDISEFELIAGPKLRRALSAMVTKVSGATNTFSYIRTFNTEFKGKIGSVVQQFDGDFGLINIHPTLWNAHVNFGGSAAANLRRGYLLRMKFLSMHYKRMPRVKQLEDRGGGPRFLCDAVLSFKVTNPLGLGAFKATT